MSKTRYRIVEIKDGFLIKYKIQYKNLFTLGFWRLLRSNEQGYYIWESDNKSDAYKIIHKLKSKKAKNESTINYIDIKE